MRHHYVSTYIRIPLFLTPKHVSMCVYYQQDVSRYPNVWIVFWRCCFRWGSWSNRGLKLLCFSSFLAGPERHFSDHVSFIGVTNAWMHMWLGCNLLFWHSSSLTIVLHFCFIAMEKRHSLCYFVTWFCSTLKSRPSPSRLLRVAIYFHNNPNYLKNND